MTVPAPVVILANGSFPTHPVPLALLHKAATLICTDGSREKALQAGLSPTLTVGDMDSTTESPGRRKETIHANGDPETTDLEKALGWCLNNGIDTVVLLGIAGGREDHTLANLHILANYAASLDVTGVTDHFTIHCVRNRKTFKTLPGQRASVLPILDAPVVTTKGLRYVLTREPLKPGGRGISNRATGDSFSVSVKNGSVLVFIQHPA